MDELLYRMLDMGVGTPNPESTQEVEGAEGGDGDSTSQNKAKARVQKKLIVEQVKILDVDGNMVNYKEYFKFWNRLYFAVH
jgi:hypothetical protein